MPSLRTIISALEDREDWVEIPFKIFLQIHTARDLGVINTKSIRNNHSVPPSPYLRSVKARYQHDGATSLDGMSLQVVVDCETSSYVIWLEWKEAMDYLKSLPEGARNVPV